MQVFLKEVSVGSWEGEVLAGGARKKGRTEEFFRVTFRGGKEIFWRASFWLEEDNGDRVRRKHSQVPSSRIPY